MDCAICMAYLREKNRCGGCYTANRKCSRHCTLAACTQVKDRYRHDCEEFPCRRLVQLDKRYRTKYHMSMLENLAAIRDHGIRAFVKSERERWTCKACGGTIDVHHYRCSACGKVPE
jgi:tRNA G26 N,N-dimethylase Trm1